MILNWTPVRNEALRGRPIAYWRLQTPENQSLGAISRRDASGTRVVHSRAATRQWHAQTYNRGQNGPSSGTREDLGNHHSRLFAERAVYDALRRQGSCITCPKCKHTSFNPNDIRAGYCAHCKAWTQ